MLGKLRDCSQMAPSSTALFVYINTRSPTFSIKQRCLWDCRQVRVKHPAKEGQKMRMPCVRARDHPGLHPGQGGCPNEDQTLKINRKTSLCVPSPCVPSTQPASQLLPQAEPRWQRPDCCRGGGARAQRGVFAAKAVSPQTSRFSTL